MEIINSCVMKNIQAWLDFILSFLGVFSIILLIIRFLILTGKKTISPALQILDTPDECFYESFTSPPKCFNYPENECPRSNEKTVFSTEKEIIKDFKIIEMENNFINNKWNIKKGKTLKIIKQITPEFCVEIAYSRPECSPPEIMVEWKDSCYRKGSYIFNYNGYGKQSCSVTTYKGTIFTFLGKLIGIF